MAATAQGDEADHAGRLRRGLPRDLGGVALGDFGPLGGFDRDLFRDSLRRSDLAGPSNRTMTSELSLKVPTCLARGLSRLRLIRKMWPNTVLAICTLSQRHCQRVLKPALSAQPGQRIEARHLFERGQLVTHRYFLSPK